MRRYDLFAPSLLAALLLLAHNANADAYKWSAVPDSTFITITEGQMGLVHYTFTNSGTEPVWIFIFSNPVVSVPPVFGDRTDRALAHYFGPDRSDGVKVDAGDTFKFGYRLTTPEADKKPESPTDPDSGVEAFRPNIAFDLREGPKITDPPVPNNAGAATAFEVEVVDARAAPTPEPAGFALAGVALTFLLAVRFANKLSPRGPSCSRMQL